jgi:uncharacterized protein (DUF1697 family)
VIVIEITSPNQLPKDVELYLFSEDEFDRIIDDNGTAYKLTRTSPKIYVEFYVESKEEK